MRVTSLSISNFRSFVNSGPIDLEQVNVLIGANNAGKSSILKALYAMQGHVDAADVRIGNIQTPIMTAAISIGLVGINVHEWIQFSPPDAALEISIVANNRVGAGQSFTLSGRNVSPVQGVEPVHFIVPYFSKRKTAGYQEDVRDQFARNVTDNLVNLAAKLSRIGNSSFPGNAKYSNACKEILGFVVTAVPSANGQRPGVYLDDRQTLFIDQMGEGVPNVVGLLVDLVLSEGKLFLIEEPENDLHPKALKALLDLILESSASNQFVVSTHSNIVVRYLGSAPNARLFNVFPVDGSVPPVAEIRQIERTPEARLAVLRDLGYAFADFDLWDGWLILEEASAERIIRDYLIPWFAPKLTRIRTVAVGGTGNLSPSFEDFHRMVRFTHLEEAYRGAVWVRADGDSSGKAAIDRLKTNYPTWSNDRFSAYSEEQFERYYPVVFRERIEAILAITDRYLRRKEKNDLLKDVRAWLDEDVERGTEALQESAREIIEDLKAMERQLLRSDSSS